MYTTAKIEYLMKIDKLQSAGLKINIGGLSGIAIPTTG